MKVILDVNEPDQLGLAIRAVKWLIEHPETRDTIIAYGEAPETRDFYVKRCRTAITVKECSRA